MFVVEVRMCSEVGLASEICAMRTWLDDQRLGAGIFRYRVRPGCVVLTIEFAIEAEARAFAAAFLGRVVPGRERAES